MRRLGDTADTKDELPKSIDYYTPPRSSHFRKWFRLPGPDSALASASLLFAVLPFPFFVAGILLTNFDSSACFSVPISVLGLMLGMAALIERDTSKLLPSVAIALSSLLLFLVATVRFIR